MLKNVKSSYFLRVLFSFTDEKQKLKLIKYNKSLQKNIDINLIDYKIFSGRYIIYEQNGNGKEYDYASHIIYEGEYLNGERNGKGKEYHEFCYTIMLMFEGEYSNGLRNGKGKEYLNGKLKFEGEYLDNKRWKGNEYDRNGKIIKYINELKNGKGKEYNVYDNGKIAYEGEYLNGLRHGKGKEYNNDGKLIFEGEYYKNKKWEGKGYDINSNVVYILKKGKGLVKEYYDFNCKLMFEFEYLNGERNGKGKDMILMVN